MYARIKQLYLDNLLTTDGLMHIDGKVDEDEEMSPTLLNTAILHWLQVLHPDLRDMVTQKFLIQLRDNTYASILPEISQSVDALLRNLTESLSVSRLSGYSQNRQPYSQGRPQFSANASAGQHKPFYKPSYSSGNFKPNFNMNTKSSYQQRQQGKSCQFCKLTGKKMFHTHNIEECFFVKRMQSVSVNQVYPESEDWDLQCQEFYEHTGEEGPAYQAEFVINKVNSDASPVLELRANNQDCLVTLDTGAPCNLINEEKAKQLHATIKPTVQRVRMADGATYYTIRIKHSIFLPSSAEIQIPKFWQACLS